MLDQPPGKCRTRMWDIERKHVVHIFNCKCCKEYKTFRMAFLDVLPPFFFQVKHAAIPTPREQHRQQSAYITTQAVVPPGAAVAIPPELR